MLKEYASLDDFTRKWQDADRKEAIIHELEQQGIIWEVLAEEVGKDLDPFDMLCHLRVKSSSEAYSLSSVLRV
ncbi:type I restriction-modification enzyme R subunit C-terminal domain-containing protein [Escherichia coli]|uniref:type I restriction-modification enzyme R subunit C-terminal domain-containing protein n=1 Tax=Escherichia coli TaxID=562 RepID=UPI003D817F60